MQTTNERARIVTGAGAGIGRAIVREFLDDGARVIAVDMNDASLAELGREAGLTTVVADLSDTAGIERVLAAAEEAGGAGVLVNNAGIMDAFATADAVTDELWDRVMAVNLTAPMRLCRGVLPGMLDGGGGVIVNIASIGGLVGGRAGAAYTASKHGLIGLTRHIAAAYAGDSIRCVAVAPGAVATGIPLGGEPNARGYATLEKTLATNPRAADPAEIARVVAFLASDGASFVNGSVIVADGGWLAF